MSTTVPSHPGSGTIYTETVVFAPPEQFTADAPYQLVIVALDSGGRLTGRIIPHNGVERVQIGDPVEFAEWRDGIPFFRHK